MSLNIAERVLRATETVPDHIALVFEGERWSYRQLSAAIRHAAGFLLQRGLSQGDAVALMLANTPFFPVFYYGALWAGLKVVPMNPALRAREIRAIAQDAGVGLLVIEPEARTEVDKALTLSDGEPWCAVTDTNDFMGFFQMHGAAEPEVDMARTAPGDVAAIIYTYGVPERMCGAELTHFNLYQNARSCMEDALVYQPGDVFLAVLPLFHGFGQTTMMNAPFLAQSTVVLCPRFDAHQVSRAIASEGVTIAAFVPTMFQLLLAGDKHGAFDFSSVRAAVSGGAAMPVALAQQFTERYGVTVLEGYGLTETSPVLSFNRPEDHRLGSLGKPIRDCEVAIMRPDGSFASPGETGEIVARGDFVMKGYHGQPEETAKATQGGWFHTRDLGYFDEEGYLHFAGLIKDLVITSGMNVSPAEVEKVLLDHPAVAAAAVIGASDTLRGEIVTAFAVLHAEAEVTEKELNAYCREQLAPYKKPRRWIFVEALPRDASGRVDKQALRMALAAGADEAAR